MKALLTCELLFDQDPNQLEDFASESLKAVLTAIQTGDKIDQSIYTAVDYLNACGESLKAFNFLTYFSHRDPDDARIELLIAFQYFWLGRVNIATQLLKKICQNQKASADSWQLLAAIYYRNGEYQFCADSLLPLSNEITLVSFSILLEALCHLKLFEQAKRIAELAVIHHPNKRGCKELFLKSQINAGCAEEAYSLWKELDNYSLPSINFYRLALSLNSKFLLEQEKYMISLESSYFDGSNGPISRLKINWDLSRGVSFIENQVRPQSAGHDLSSQKKYNSEVIVDCSEIEFFATLLYCALAEKSQERNIIVSPFSSILQALFENLCVVSKRSVALSMAEGEVKMFPPEVSQFQFSRFKQAVLALSKILSDRRILASDPKSFFQSEKSTELKSNAAVKIMSEILDRVFLSACMDQMLAAISDVEWLHLPCNTEVLIHDELIENSPNYLGLKLSKLRFISHLEMLVKAEFVITASQYMAILSSFLQIDTLYLSPSGRRKHFLLALDANNMPLYFNTLKTQEISASSCSELLAFTKL